jgi:hypothetical protein
VESRPDQRHIQTGPLPGAILIAASDVKSWVVADPGPELI